MHQQKVPYNNNLDKILSLGTELALCQSSGVQNLEVENCWKIWAQLVQDKSIP
jgi:hypothetical protein